MTHVIDEKGNELIGKLDYLPQPGEVLLVNGKRYVVADGKPVTQLVERGQHLPGAYMRVIVAKPESAKGDRRQVVAG